MEKGSLYEGDGILLFCEKAKGFIFSPPPLDPKVSSVSIHSIEKIANVTTPGFPNVHYASFKIEPRTCLANGNRPTSKTNKQLVYGRKVHLYHVASKWYLSFENNSIDTTIDHEIATLVADKNEATLFRIIPSDPTKSTGQTISVEDSVRLEIISQQGNKSQALCVPNLLNFSGFDLKKASDGSDFKIYSQSTGQKLGPPLALRGGEVVMFLNEKRDAFITVRKDTNVVAKVSDRTNSKTKFSGGNSYWQIENAAVQYDGNWVDLEIPWHVRIKHLPSKKYLVLVKNEEGRMCFQLEDKSNGDNDDDDSIFHFEEDRIDSAVGLLKRRYVLIKHVKTNTYVTLDGKSGKLDDDGGTRYFKISPELSTDAISDYRDQKFWIEEVDEEILKKFSTLYGAFIVLQEYLEKINNDDVVGAPTHIVNALANWTEMQRERKDSKQRWPDMLRAIKGVDLVLEFLTLKTDSSIKRHLCTVLENYITVASKESQLYLISKERLLETLMNLMGLKIGAEKVLSALIRCHSFSTKDKQKVLVEFFEKRDVLKDIENNKDFEFLKCLSALCMSGGKAERNIQCDIVEHIIIPGHQQGIFFRIVRGDDNVTVKKPKMFMDESDNEPHLETDLITQIEFYASVCEGVNLDSIDRMTKINNDVREDEILTFSAAKMCLEHYKSPKIQSVFYSYLVSAMVDKNAEESGIDLDNIWYIYSWVRFLKPDQTFQPILLSAVANTHDIVSDADDMIEMQNNIQKSLEENWDKDITENREDLMAQRLRVLETLVSYGFYWKADVEHKFKIPCPSDVIQLLISILGHRVETEKQIALANLQSRAIKVLHLFLHQTYHLATSRIMYDYRFFHKDVKEPFTDKNGENYVIPKDSLGRLTSNDYQVESQNVLIPQLQQSHWINQRVAEARDRLKWLLYEEPAKTLQLYRPGQDPQTMVYDYKHLNIYDSNSAKCEDLQTLLIDFMSSQKNDHLLITAAKLFFDLFKGESFMFNRAEKSLIVLESYVESWETYTTMVKFATYQDKQRINEVDTHIRALLRLHQGKGASDATVKESIMNFANDVIGTAGTTPWPDGSNGFQPRDETYTNITGQKIVLTTGVFGLFLNYIVKYSSTEDPEQMEILHKICATMLTIMRGNNDAKEIVFARFEDLLCGVKSMAYMLTEVLTDNITACRKLPFSIVRKMFRLVVTKDFHEFVPAIEAWMKVGKSSPHLLKAHQRYVASLYEQNFKDHHETGWNIDTSPLELLRKENNDKFVLLTHLLAVCCEGIHKYSEDCARNVFRIPTLVKIVVGDIYTAEEPGAFFPLEKRLPFVMILNEAFLKTERESLISVMEIAKNKLFWQHVKDVTEMVELVKTRLDAVKEKAWEKTKIGKPSPSQRILYCQMIKIKALQSQHFTHMYWKDHQVYYTNLKKAPFKEEKIDFEGNTITHGVLYQYIIEGMLPLLSGFAEEYITLWRLYKERLGEEGRPMTRDNGKILLDFGNTIKTLVSTHGNIFAPTDHHRIYWEMCLKPIVNGQSMFCPPPASDISGIVTEDWDGGCTDHKLSIEPFEYKKLDKGDEQDMFKENETRINNDFKNYLHNFQKLLYYNDFDNIEDSLYPKGPGFQHLLEKLFVIDENKCTYQNQPKYNNKTIVQRLVYLLGVLHKKINQHHDSKETSALSELVINILQVLSGVLYKVSQNDEANSSDINDDQKGLCKWQKMFRKENVHKACMIHLNHDNPEIVLQILGLLKLLTQNANIDTQNDIFEEISDRDSAFCHRVYDLLEEVISTFNETWAKMDMPADSQTTTTTTPMMPRAVPQRSTVTSFDSSNENETDDGIALVSPANDDKTTKTTTTMKTTTLVECPTNLSIGDHSIDEGTGTLEIKSLDDNIRTATIVLDCISALCDGQHRKIQGFLLDQDQSFKKLDIIKRMAILLDCLTDQYEKVLNLGKKNTEPKRVFAYLDLIETAIQALIETTAGNYENQQAVFQCQITDTMNLLLVKLVNNTIIPMNGWNAQDKSTLRDTKEQLSQKSIELLQVLLEETHDDSLSLIANFTEDVDLKAIIDAMIIWKDIGAYHILRLIANSQDVSVDRLVYKRINFKNKNNLDLWNDFKARSRCIEVLYRPNKEEDKKILTKVYFDFDPLDEVREEDKETVTNAITEQSQEENLTEFNKWGGSIRRNAKYMHENFLDNGNWIWLYRLIYETSGPRQILLSFLTILLNLFVLSVYVVPEDRTFNATGTAPNFILFPLVPEWYYPILLPILGGIHILLSLWMVIEFIVKEKPNLTKNVFFITAFKSLWKTFTRWVSQQEIFKDHCRKDWRLKQIRKAPKDTSPDAEYEELYYYEDEDDEGYFQVDMFGFQSVYRFVFLFCSVVAIPLRGYPYSICLFYVFLNIDVVQHILEALTRSRKQLLFVALISASVLLVFAIVGFIFIHDYFEASSPLFCNTLWECFISVSREGLLDTLGPAIPFTIAAQGDDATPSYTHYAIRTIFYDLPFFLIVTTIVLNIVTAVLIDRFSALREERDTVESNKTKACFICGLETEKFERFGKGFRTHVKEDHNKWNYIYYLIYLDRKPINDLTALEKQIADDNKINERFGKTGHYPIKMAKVLPKDKQGEDDE